jgi:hypothetical protein
MRVGRHIGLSAAGLWLMFLIAGAVFAAAIIFSATQSQARLATLTLYGGPLSAWKADQIREEWATTLAVVDAGKQAVSQREKQLAETLGESNKLSNRNRDLTGRNILIRTRLIPRIALLDSETARAMRGSW